MLIDGLVRKLQRTEQDLLDTLHAERETLAAANFGDERLGRHRACHIAGFRAAHTVADDHEGPVVAEFHDVVGVLILAADVAGIGEAPDLHGHSSLLFFSYFLRS